ncbi:MAG: hypothetical protein QOG64_2419 [Acidimicrobiaceae bacterium]|nr:hypothetical protein [Acidimicrobiaceae bacterium]
MLMIFADTPPSRVFQAKSYSPYRTPIRGLHEWLRRVISASRTWLVLHNGEVRGVEVRRGLAVVVGTLLAVALAGVVLVPSHPAQTRSSTRLAEVAPTLPAAPTTTAVPTTVPPPPTTTTTEPPPVPAVTLSGCPPPPRPPGHPSAPWHPALLVPDAALAEPAPAAPRQAALTAVAGKGMWIWKYRLSEKGDAGAIVSRAERAGLTNLWVRVGDSQSGFYGASILDDLVPVAHQHGISVIGWGFPYLYDPVGDATWTAAALAWQGPDGSRLDAFSPDIETPSEGTALSARRAVLYLSLVRGPAASSGRPLIATVFPPSDQQILSYPFAAMAPYVDAFAPMVYWGCREPGDAAAGALTRLAAMAPLHLIGQAYDMGPEGGRIGAPSEAEIRRFSDVARRGGALGVSFWDWQEMTAEEWGALTLVPWPARQ